MAQPPRILVIEDNADDMELLMRELRKASMDQHVKAFADGMDALEYFGERGDLCANLVAIFLDLKLPRLDGLALLKAIRAKDHLAAIPVIVMTSSNSPDDLDLCKKLGVFSFVPKPLTISSFAKAFADTFHLPRSTSALGNGG